MTLFTPEKYQDSVTAHEYRLYPGFKILNVCTKGHIAIPTTCNMSLCISILQTSFNPPIEERFGTHLTRSMSGSHMTTENNRNVETRNLSVGFCVPYLYVLYRLVISLPCGAHGKTHGLLCICVHARRCCRCARMTRAQGTLRTL
jgi:hypothetical protein